MGKIDDIGIYRDLKRQRKPTNEIVKEMYFAIMGLCGDVNQEHQLVKGLHKRTLKKLNMNGIEVEYSMTNETKYISKQIVIRFVEDDIKRAPNYEKNAAMIVAYELLQTPSDSPALIPDECQYRDEIILVRRVIDPGERLDCNSSPGNDTIH